MDQLTRHNDKHQQNSKLEYPNSSCSSTFLPKNFVLSRGFSNVQANQDIVNETRSKIENKICNDGNETEQITKNDSCHCLDNILNNKLTCYSFMLPNLNDIEDLIFKEYLQNDLIELQAQYNLTESGHLNWWAQNDWECVCAPLYPMVTSGDGNCLLHAASLAMWGLHDRYLILRKALHSTLKKIKEESPLWRRWKWEQMCQNRKYGLIYDDDEWSKEWQSLLKLSSYQPRISNQSSQQIAVSTVTNASNIRNSKPLPLNNFSSANQSFASISSNSNKSNNNLNPNGSQGKIANNIDSNYYFESLEEFHVFLLAQILQRPIIIVSDTMLHDLNGEPLSPIQFGGIYLPFECDLEKCHRYPLVLAYDSAHFSALVLMDDNNYNQNEEHEKEDLYIEKTDFEIDQDYNDNENDPESSYVEQNINKIQKHISQEKINKINKKLQSRPPYSIIPLTYSNKELLPVHFSHDPGEDYDWSQFPLKKNTDSNLKNKILNSNNTSSASSKNSSNDNMSVQSIINNTNLSKKEINNKKNNNSTLEKDIPKKNIDETELSRNEKLFFIQKYLDLIKLELYDPGPLGKRNNQNQAINSRGMCANILNVYVPEPFKNLPDQNNDTIKNSEIQTQNIKSSANKLQKFLNFFKRHNNKDDNSEAESLNNPKQNKEKNTASPFPLLKSGSKFRNSIKNSSIFSSNNSNPSEKVKLKSVTSTVLPDYLIKVIPNKDKQTNSFKSLKSFTLPVKYNSLSKQSNNYVKIRPINSDTRFHKEVTFKSWDSLFESLINHTCLLGVKLNLAKSPKYYEVISNYLQSTKQRYEMHQKKDNSTHQQTYFQHKFNGNCNEIDLKKSYLNKSNYSKNPN